MSLRIVHTSDWHLGHTLHERERELEHAAFLDWLIAQVVAEEAHALLIAGDVFDTANPSARAQRQYYGFLRALRAAAPSVQIVVIGGNHDSGHRLDAPRELLGELGVHVVGVVPKREGGELDLERLVVPLRGEGGEVAAWVVAMPFIRLQDLPAEALSSAEAVVSAVRTLYAAAVAHAESLREPGQSIIAMGHAWFERAQASANSERKVQLGNEAALPVDLFGPGVQYVALGHLHLAQAVGKHSHVRYCGSPIPLALDERTYPHQVLSVTLDGDSPAVVEARRIPRTVEFLRVPASADGASLAEVLLELRNIPARDPAMPPHLLPFLDVAVKEATRVPGLRAQVDAALDGRAVHLARLVDLTPRNVGHQPAHLAAASLEEVDPEAVFLDFWRREHQGDPREAVLQRFRILLEAVQGGGVS